MGRNRLSVWLMLIGIFFATSDVAISGPVGTDTQASIGSGDPAGVLASQSCDASLFWDGFDCHLDDTITCVSGDTFEATGEGTGCSDLGRCRVYLEEGADVTFLDGSTLLLGRKMTQTSERSLD